MNPAYPQNTYPGYRPNTQPPPGMQMMDPNIAQMAQQRYMQQHQQQLAAMHAAGMIPGNAFPGGPPGQNQGPGAGQGQSPGQGQGGMRMPPGMGMGMGMGMPQGMNMMGPGQGQGQGQGQNMGMGMGMNMNMMGQMGQMGQMGMGGMPGQSPGQGHGQGQGGPSSIPPQQMYQSPHPPQPPKQKKKPGPQPKHQTPSSQMIPQNRPAPTSSDQYLKNAMQPPPSAPSVEVEPWADALDELDPRELAMNRFRTRNEMLEEVFGPEPIKSIPLGDGDAWSGLGMDGETLEAKVAALEKENEELKTTMDGKLSSWTRHLASLESSDLDQTIPPAVTA